MRWRQSDKPTSRKQPSAEPPPVAQVTVNLRLSAELLALPDERRIEQVLRETSPSASLLHRPGDVLLITLQRNDGGPSGLWSRLFSDKSRETFSMRLAEATCSTALLALGLVDISVATDANGDKAVWGRLPEWLAKP